MGRSGDGLPINQDGKKEMQQYLVQIHTCAACGNNFPVSLSVKFDYSWQKLFD